jgi:hypothetical protein
MEFQSPLERTVTERLLEDLQGLPHAHAALVEVHSVRRGVDAEIDLNIGHRRYRLLIEVKKAVYPRDTRSGNSRTMSGAPEDAITSFPF